MTRARRIFLNTAWLTIAQALTSIAALFVAGYVPGILLGLALMVVAGIIAVRRRYPVAGRPRFVDSVRAFFRAVPSLLLIVIVMGGIVAGNFDGMPGVDLAIVRDRCADDPTHTVAECTHSPSARGVPSAALAAGGEEGCHHENRSEKDRPHHPRRLASWGIQYPVPQNTWAFSWLEANLSAGRGEKEVAAATTPSRVK